MLPRILVGNCVSKIEADRQMLLMLDEKLSPESPGAFFARRNRPGWDGRWHPIDVTRGVFPSGLLEHVRQIVPYVQVVDNRPIPHRISFNPQILKDVNLVDHQQEAIQTFLGHGRGILALATSAGKTECAIAIACHISGLCVWMVHRKDLLHQTAERILLRTGEHAVKIGDGAWGEILPTTKFVVMMPQTVRQDVHFFADQAKNANLIVYDEIHRSSAAADWYRLGQLVPAYYRCGLSGTPDTGDPVRDLRIIAAAGPILMRIKAGELADMGFCARAKIIYHKAGFDRVPPDLDYMMIRRLLIEENPYRNAMICQLVLESAAVGKRSLVICDTVRHARMIKEILNGENIRVELLTGRHSGLVRSQAKKEMRSGALEAIVASPIFDEGIDLPELEVVILAAGGKSAVKMVQRIGRALRKSPGKTEATIHDFFDMGSSYMTRHSMARMMAAKKEGFEIVTAQMGGLPREIPGAYRGTLQKIMGGKP